MFQIQNVFVDVWEMHSMSEVRKWNQIYISLGWSFKASEIVSVWSFSCRLMIFQNRILNHLYVVWDIHEHYTEKKREKSNHYVENKHARMLFPWCILEHINVWTLFPHTVLILHTSNKCKLLLWCVVLTTYFTLFNKESKFSGSLKKCNFSTKICGSTKTWICGGHCSGKCSKNIVFFWSKSCLNHSNFSWSSW